MNEPYKSLKCSLLSIREDNNYPLPTDSVFLPIKKCVLSRECACKLKKNGVKTLQNKSLLFGESGPSLALCLGVRPIRPYFFAFVKMLKKYVKNVFYINLLFAGFGVAC